jgi:lipoyl(octanoyl) transferase
VARLEFEHAGFGSDAVDYQRAWDRQRALHAARMTTTLDDGTDTVMLLEHHPVYTAGKRTEIQERPVDGTQVIDVDRGGKITFHGPGQLVGYPIVMLPRHVYVVDYVRRVEEALIRACADLGLVTGRVPGRSGVWLPADANRAERKIAALGVRVSRSVTMHGFALNCDCDLWWFDRIVPCGIVDAGVTSLSKELERDVTVPEAVPYVEHHLRDLLSWQRYERSPDIVRLPEPSVTYGLTALR